MLEFLNGVGSNLRKNLSGSRGHSMRYALPIMLFATLFGLRFKALTLLPASLLCLLP